MRLVGEVPGKGVYQFCKPFSSAQVSYADECKGLLLLCLLPVGSERTDIDKVGNYDGLVRTVQIGRKVLLQLCSHANNLSGVFVGRTQGSCLAGCHLPAVDGRGVFGDDIRDAIAFVGQPGGITGPSAEMGMNQVGLAVTTDIDPYQSQCQPRPDDGTDACRQLGVPGMHAQGNHVFALVFRHLEMVLLPERFPAQFFQQALFYVDQSCLTPCPGNLYSLLAEHVAAMGRSTRLGIIHGEYQYMHRLTGVWRFVCLGLSDLPARPKHRLRLFGRTSCRSGARQEDLRGSES